jgi:hypothetical protein
MSKQFLRNSSLIFFLISIYPYVKNSHSLTLEKPKKNRQKSKNDSIKKAKVFTQGTFLQNYRKTYQGVSKIQVETDGRTDRRNIMRV